MSEVAVEVKEIPLDDEAVSQAEYRQAREKGESVVQRPVEAPAEEQKAEETQHAEAEEPKTEEKHKSKGGGFQRKIDRLIKEAKSASERAEAAEKRLQEIESRTPAKQEPAKPAVQGEPKKEDFTDYDAYLIARAKWEIKQEQKAAQEAKEQAEAEATAKETWDAHQERIEAAREKHEDFDEVVDVPTPWPLDNPTPRERAAAEAFRIAVLEDDNSAEILYHYGQNPEEFAALGEMTPAQVVKAVARISDKLTPKEETKAEKAEEKKIVSRANPPIKPVGTGANRSSVPPDEMSPNDYRKWREARSGR